MIHTVDTSSARSVNDTAELLLAEDGPGRLRAGIRAVQMNLGDLVPLLVTHVLEPRQIEVAMSLTNH